MEISGIHFFLDIMAPYRQYGIVACMVIIINWQEFVNFTFLCAGYFCITDSLQLCSRAKLSYLRNTVIFLRVTFKLCEVGPD